MNRRKIILAALLILVLCLLQGCKDSEAKVTTGKGSLVPVTKEEDEEETTMVQSELYAVIGIQKETKQIAFKRLGSRGERYFYNYNGATYILDKYGKNTTIDSLAVGDVVEIEADTANGKVMKVQKSDEVWIREGVTDVKISGDGTMITFDEENYRPCDEMVAILKGNEMELSELSPLDELSITGKGKEVYSIVVTQGHGTIVFVNTKIFDGGYCTVGNHISSVVEEGLEVEVRAGTHKVTIANKGYGGNCEVKVKVGKTTTIDLTEMAKDAKKEGVVTFRFVQKNVELAINGKTVNASKPLTLEYGTYRLTANAEGFEEWSRVLLLSSEKVLIEIDLEDVSSSETVEVDEDGETQEEDNRNSNTSNRNDDEDEDLEDELEEALLDAETSTSALIDDVFDMLTGND